MVARACANMGCGQLLLVAPERWDYLKAEPLATAAGANILGKLRVFPDLAAALAPYNLVVATTARLGGWRRQSSRVEDAAPAIMERCAEGEKLALVFGPEDRGLTNEELNFCDYVVNIPTESGASSLNLAQATLIMLHECRRAIRKPKKTEQRGGIINNADWRRLEQELVNCLEMLHCVGGQNPDYYFQIWHGMFSRIRLRRREYDALMGFCRQLRNRLHE